MFCDSRCARGLQGTLSAGLALIVAACSGGTRSGSGSGHAFDAVYLLQPGEGAEAYGVRLGFETTALGKNNGLCGWSPDRRWVCLVDEAGDEQTCAIVSAEGARSSFSADYATVRWSPDSERLAFTLRGVPFVSDADGSNAIAVPTEARTADAVGLIFLNRVVWSPDSARVAFQLAGELTQTDEAGVVVVTDSQAAVATTVSTSSPSASLGVFWSPDARHLAVQTRDGFVLMDSTGAQPVNVGKGNYPSGWSPDSAWFAFDGTVASADGALTFEASSQPVGVDLNAIWSPTEATLAFAGFEGVSLWSPQGSRNLTPLRTVDLAWSPDGTKLAVVASANSQGWYMPLLSAADGTEVASLEHTSVVLRGYGWNRTGSRLWHLRDLTLDVGDGNGQKLVPVATGVADANWLTDDEQIIFVTGQEISILGANGQRTKRLWSGTSEAGAEPWLLK